METILKIRDKVYVVVLAHCNLLARTTDMYGMDCSAIHKELQWQHKY